ncbi:hypothetical protein BB050_03397 [Flavobacterium anhuiense]|uniref:Lipoprotein n=1 Tax=Flavobacterium anhuiense TaxID=459526 RepID=A0AAC9GKQ4_9FLAO|nr:hypothetical protein [Flavobacterium anhuiense]AOC96486.1 hypothetical protein BB050_03397 [Flavobacterium anhuiense]
MKKFFCHILVVLILCSCGHYINNRNKNIDIFFRDWNIAISNSIVLQQESVSDEHQKFLYKNRLEAFKAQIRVTNDNQLNKNEIRYKFIKQYFTEFGQNTFYIIEANESGERRNIISYVVFPDSISKIIKYKYENAKWEKIKEKEIGKKFEFDKNKYVTKFGEGKNENDVIVTHVENKRIISSDYFLLLTMKEIDILGSVSD